MLFRLQSARRRTLQAFADVATAERSALDCALRQTAELARVCGAGADPIMAFHTLPRDPSAAVIDGWDYGEDDHVLVAVDIVDVTGRRRRLSAAGLHEAQFAQPVTVAAHAGFAPTITLPPAARTSPEGFGRDTLAALWQFATISWVDVCRATAQWVGGAVAPSLLVCPAEGHLLAFPPMSDGDERVPTSVVSLAPVPAQTPVEDLEAALANILTAEDARSLDDIETDVLHRAQVQGLVLPGFPLDPSGECSV